MIMILTLNIVCSHHTVYCILLTYFVSWRSGKTDQLRKLELLTVSHALSHFVIGFSLVCAGQCIASAVGLLDQVVLIAALARATHTDEIAAGAGILCLVAVLPQPDGFALLGWA